MINKIKELTTEDKTLIITGCVGFGYLILSIIINL